MNEKGQKMAQRKKEEGYSEEDIRKACLAEGANKSGEQRQGRGKGGRRMARAQIVRPYWGQQQRRQQNGQNAEAKKEKHEHKVNKLGMYEDYRQRFYPPQYKYYNAEDGLSNILHLLVKGLPESDFSEKYIRFLI